MKIMITNKKKLDKDEGLRIRREYRFLELYDNKGLCICGSKDTINIFYYGNRSICEKCFDNKIVPKNNPPKFVTDVINKYKNNFL